MSFILLKKSKKLGRSLQFSASMLDICSTTPTYKTQIYRSNFTFVTIRNYIITLVSINFNWYIETLNMSIRYGETGHGPKVS